MARVSIHIALFVSVVFFSCTSIGTRQKSEQQFYYYPKKNVYFDVQKQAFLYSLDGAKTWVSVPGKLDNTSAVLGQGIEVNSDSTDVYKDNETHRKLYAGNLYNIVREDNDASAEPEVSDRKVVQKPQLAEAVTPPEEKPKKGLGKFLNKIFGRKNKDKK